MGGEIQARLQTINADQARRLAEMGISDPNRIFKTEDLAPGENIVFSCTGVTDGGLLRGVRFFGDGTRTSSVIMQNQPHQIRFIDSIHVPPDTNVKIRF